MSTQLSLLYVTFSLEENAVKVAHKLLSKKLVACINILGSIKSIYNWNDSVHTNQEVAVLLKTTKEKVSETITVLEKLHPYDTPAILEVPLGQAADSFRKWVQASVE